MMLRHRLGEDPTFARAGAVGEGLMGCLHAGPFDGVGEVAVDVGDVILFGVRAVVAVVIDVVPAGEAIPKVLVSLQSV